MSSKLGVAKLTGDYSWLAVRLLALLPLLVRFSHDLSEAQRVDSRWLSR